MKMEKLQMRAGLLCLIAAMLLFAAGCGARSGQDAGTETSADSAGMVGTETDEADTLSQAKEHLLTVWADYLSVMEAAYSSELWALDYVDRFAASGTWQDLSRARAACVTAAGAVAGLSMTEEDLTDGEYLILFQAGIDTEYQSMEFASAPDAAEDVRSEIRTQLLEDLESGIFTAGGMEILAEKAALYREGASLLCQYYCCATNYMLLSLKDPDRAEQFRSEMADRYPVLMASGYEWVEDEDAALSSADEILDSYQLNISARTSVLSGMSADLYDLEQLLEAGDPEAMAQAAAPISGHPHLLPAPGWYDPMTAGYLAVTVGEEGSISYPAVGEELTEDVYSAYLQISDVADDEVQQYIDRLAEEGILAWKSDSGENWYIDTGEYQVSFSRQEEGALTILFYGQDVTFAPEWYLAANHT